MQFDTSYKTVSLIFHISLQLQKAMYVIHFVQTLVAGAQDQTSASRAETTVEKAHVWAPVIFTEGQPFIVKL